MTDEQMMRATAVDRGFEKYRKPTRRDVFLAEMDQVVPWAALCEQIEPVYPKATRKGGRRPIGLERMLRIHFLQQWYSWSDPAAEEALYDSYAMRQFVGIDLSREAVPDETTVCKFRHLLEQHNLAQELFKVVEKHIQAHGMSCRAAPSWMPRSSRHRLRPRTRSANAIWRCIKRRKATSGTSA